VQNNVKIGLYRIPVNSSDWIFWSQELLLC
jgi:hypothetical protein